MWQTARAGDSQVIQLLLERLGPRVARLGAYYARRTGVEREELVQEGMLALLEGVGEGGAVGQGSDAAARLVRLARWRMLDWVRWTRRRAGRVLDEEPAVLDPTLDEAAERLDVGAFVACLKPRQAQVACGLMAGGTWREVATQMGCSSANLAYHVRQIRATYQRRYAE